MADEFEAHNKILAGIRKVAPRARKVFLPGNHEANILSINRIDRKLRGLCDYRKQPDLQPELMKHWEQPVEYILDSKRGVFRLGQVAFSHGFKTTPSGDEWHSIRFCVPFGLYVGGHTHRPLIVTQARKSPTLTLPYWYANAGTMRDIWDVDYMDRKDRSRWGQAVIVGEAKVGGKVALSQEWSAETRFFRMYEDL